jgi:acyl carrier protein
MVDVNSRRIAVREIVIEMVGHRVEDSEPIVSSGLMDSLSVLSLITQLEQRLKVAISSGNLQPEDFDSVDLIVETLEREAR